VDRDPERVRLLENGSQAVRPLGVRDLDPVLRAVAERERRVWQLACVVIGQAKLA
jgi:hypothetical protein